MDKRITEYLDLKSQLKEVKKQPVGNRIKKGGPLESRIKEVFSEQKVKEILTRTDDCDFVSYEALKERFCSLRSELEEEGIITQDDEGNEIINR